MWLESLTLLTISTGDLVVLAVSFALVLVPTYRLVATGEDTTLRRIYTLYHGVGMLAFLCACAALAYWLQPGGSFEKSLWHLDASRVPHAARPVLFGLLAFASFVRMGVAPLHSWLPLSLERGSLFAVTLLVSVARASTCSLASRCPPSPRPPTRPCRCSPRWRSSAPSTVPWQRSARLICDACWVSWW